MKLWSVQCPICSQRIETEREESWGLPPVPQHNSGSADCKGSNQLGVGYRPAAAKNA